jgi:hypothetical protein
VPDLAGDFKSDAFVCSGDKRDFVRGLQIHSLSCVLLPACLQSLERHTPGDLNALAVDQRLSSESNDAIIGPMSSGWPTRPSAVISA